MTISFNPSISAIQNIQRPDAATKVQQEKTPASSFAQAIEKSLLAVNEDQQKANLSIVDLLSGKQQDVNTVIAEMAKADMSFKVLVGVRNKLVEAYKETMRMQI